VGRRDVAVAIDRGQHHFRYHDRRWGVVDQRALSALRQLITSYVHGHRPSDRGTEVCWPRSIATATSPPAHGLDCTPVRRIGVSFRYQATARKELWFQTTKERRAVTMPMGISARGSSGMYHLGRAKHEHAGLPRVTRVPATPYGMVDGCRFCLPPWFPTPIGSSRRAGDPIRASWRSATRK